jgi:hypothetical protein
VFITKFTDDTKGQQEIKSEDDKRKMQEALYTLWRRQKKKWGMQFNLEKFKIMHVGETILNVNIK